MDDLEAAENGRDLTAGLEYELRQLERERLWQDHDEQDELAENPQLHGWEAGDPLCRTIKRG